MLQRLGQEVDTHYPWLQYGRLVAGLDDDKRFRAWWVLVFHELLRIKNDTGREVGVAFATAAQTEWSDCIVFERCPETQEAMARARRLLQILYRGNRAMHFDFELDQLTLLKPFVLNEFLDMSTVTRFPAPPPPGEGTEPRARFWGGGWETPRRPSIPGPPDFHILR